MPSRVSRNGKRLKIDAVFLTASVEEFERAALAGRTASIRVYPAATTKQAESQMIATNSRVLLVALGCLQEGWEAALAMIRRLHPPRVLVVAAKVVDERFRSTALRRGAVDVVWMPFEGEELRRILENATFLAAKPARRRTAWLAG